MVPDRTRLCPIELESTQKCPTIDTSLNLLTGLFLSMDGRTTDMTTFFFSFHIKNLNKMFFFICSVRTLRFKQQNAHLSIFLFFGSISSILSIFSTKDSRMQPLRWQRTRVLVLLMIRLQTTYTTCRTRPFRDQQHTSYFWLTRTFDFQLDGARFFRQYWPHLKTYEVLLVALDATHYILCSVHLCVCLFVWLFIFCLVMLATFILIQDLTMVVGLVYSNRE